jgi:hypothetical protein
MLGKNGRLNDALVFSKCTFDEALRKNTLNMPVVRVLVAVEALPLFFEETFNKMKIYLTLGVSENAFGKMVQNLECTKILLHAESNK